MNIAWIDILKLTFPFLTAILMVWIKVYAEAHLSLSQKRHAMSRLIDDALNGLEQAVTALKNIAKSAREGKLQLVNMDVSALIVKFATEMSDLDASRAYFYAHLVSCVEVVNKGLSCLSSLVISRASAVDPVSDQLDRVIIGQSKVVAEDLEALGKACLKVLDVIPPRNRYQQDAQALSMLKAIVEKAEKCRADWPALPKSA